MKVEIISQQPEEKADKLLKKTGSERFEWFMFKVFLTVFIILISAQAALLNPFVRSTVSNYYIEGEPLGTEVYLYVPCRMELTLINMEQCPDLKVFVNGMEREAFNGNSVLLDLKNGDVVELDASSVLVLATVQISAVSENIGGILGKTVSISDGIVFIGRVKITK